MRSLSLLLFLSLLVGCAGQSSKNYMLLTAPAGTKPAVAAQLEKGSALFSSRDYAGAEQAFKHTIAAEPTLAEAHYNLAITLDQEGNEAEAKKHYIEAANLAPGNKVIWSSPAFQDRTKSMGFNVEKKLQYQDPTYKGF
jgi:Flp pilus assembly protein TadD